MLVALTAGCSALVPAARVVRAHRSRTRPVMSLTEELMSTLPDETQTGGAGGASTYKALLQLDSAWENLKNGRVPPTPRLVSDEPSAAVETAEYDVVVCGGNIGILLATALVLKGLRVAVVEAAALRGREQDWNASRKEVEELVEAGVLSRAEVDEVIGIEFNPVRCGFAGGQDVWTTDVLNVGVRPAVLIERARARFEAAGGVVLERSPLASVAIRPGAAVLCTAGGDVLRSRLLIDCMGQRSPIVAQARDGALPEGACVVVGSCADNFAPEANTYGDVIFADREMIPAGAAGCPTQYFWEVLTVLAALTALTVLAALTALTVLAALTALTQYLLHFLYSPSLLHLLYLSSLLHLLHLLYFLLAALTALLYSPYSLHCLLFLLYLPIITLPLALPPNIISGRLSRPRRHPRSAPHISSRTWASTQVYLPFLASTALTIRIALTTILPYIPTASPIWCSTQSAPRCRIRLRTTG